MKRLFLLTCAALGVPACGGGGDDDGGLTYRTTTWYHFRTRSSAMSVTQVLMSSADVTAYQQQTGTTQTAGTGLIFGSVDDSGSGTPISGATVVARNDAGASAGVAVYRDTSGLFDPGLTSTSANGDFILLGVPPGRVNLRCTAGASGNLHVKSVADETTLASLRATAGFATVTWSGVTRKLVSLPGTPEGSVLITGLGTGLPFPLTSDGAGAFSAGTVPALQTYFLKLTKSGFVDTYDQYVMGAASVTTPDGDLLIVSTADRDSTAFKPASVTLTAGTAIIRGEVTPPSGTVAGYAVACTKLDGSVNGVLRYGDTSGAPDDALTATSTSGVFYLYNVDPGTVFVRAFKTGFGGSTYVDTFADAITLVQGQLAPADNSPGSDSIGVSGFLVTFAGFEVPDGAVERLGQGAAVMSGGSGFYSMTGVPSNHRFLIKTHRP